MFPIVATVVYCCEAATSVGPESRLTWPALDWRVAPITPDAMSVALIVRFLMSALVTLLFLIAALVTEFLLILTAAYELPPSATNSAIIAITLAKLRCLRILVTNFFLLGLFRA